MQHGNVSPWVTGFLLASGAGRFRTDPDQSVYSHKAEKLKRRRKFLGPRKTRNFFMFFVTKRELNMDQVLKIPVFKNHRAFNAEGAKTRRTQSV